MAIRRPDVEITITFILPAQVAELLPQCSIERMINATLELTANSNHELANINYDDWRIWKWPVRSLFEGVKDALLCKAYGFKQQPYKVQNIGP